jgi:alpha-N-arabinofuranosidase
VLSDQDPEAANTMDEPDRVQLAPLAIHRDEPGSLKVVLPPISWAEILLELR